MKKDDIKNVVGKLVPDKDLESRMYKKISQKEQHKFPLKYMASIAACVILAFSLGIIARYFNEKKADIIPIATSSEEGINVPKIQLPTNTNAQMDMIGLIVYQGRIYTQTSTTISPGYAEKLLGEKLGTTKGNLDEWSKQKDYAVEFASTIGKMDVYSVKDYDKNFRIMTYEKQGGTVYAEFFECFNGITIKSGADVFEKLKIENNIKLAKQEKFESWNYSKQQYKEVKNLQILNSFANELKNSIPCTQQSLSYLFENQGDTQQKFVYIVLNDGCQVQLRLFKDGYIFHDSSHIFFKMDNEVFRRLWNELE